MAGEHTLAEQKGHTMMHIYTPKSMSLPSAKLTFHTLRNPRNSPYKTLKLMVTMTRSKVKSRSHHGVAHLQPLTNVPTKYQLLTPYSFRDIAQTIFYRSRSLWQGQRSNQGHTMMLHHLHQCP